jgi:NTP pyrophosphatase (non-canonical NTP hydrolase)
MHSEKSILKSAVRNIAVTEFNIENEIITLDQYQNFANAVSGHEFVALIEDSFKVSHELVFNALGLAGEAGEVVEKVKKAIRLSNINNVYDSLTEEKKKGIAKELGDTLYYLSRVADMLGLKLSDVARFNQEKLLDRLARGVVKGEGDDR